jgi:hypothetical protein
MGVVAGWEHPSPTLLDRRHPQVLEKGHQIRGKEPGERIAQEQVGASFLVGECKMGQKVVEPGCIGEITPSFARDA